MRTETEDLSTLIPVCGSTGHHELFEVFDVHPKYANMGTLTGQRDRSMSIDTTGRLLPLFSSLNPLVERESDLLGLNHHREGVGHQVTPCPVYE